MYARGLTVGDVVGMAVAAAEVGCNPAAPQSILYCVAPCTSMAQWSHYCAVALPVQARRGGHGRAVAWGSHDRGSSLADAATHSASRQASSRTRITTKDVAVAFQELDATLSRESAIELGRVVMSWPPLIALLGSPQLHPVTAHILNDDGHGGVDRTSLEVALADRTVTMAGNALTIWATHDCCAALTVATHTSQAPVTGRPMRWPCSRR